MTEVIVVNHDDDENFALRDRGVFMWVNQHKLNNSLVVFIHGLFGQRWATWKGIPDSLQKEFRTDPLLRSYDIYLHNYHTALLRQPRLVPFVVNDLSQFLEEVSEKYKTTVLIGHSQGGIIAKLYVVTELIHRRGKTLSVDCIITLGTPHHGFKSLNPLYWVQQIPVVGKWLPFKQVGDLASRSSNIQTLKKSWTDKYISTSPCMPTDSRRHIYSVAIAGAYDCVVGQESASGFAVDIRRYLQERHTSIAKANTRISRVADLIHRELRKHLEPKDIMKKIREILTKPTAMEGYLKEYASAVSEKVIFARPRLAAIEKAVDTKTASILIDFLQEFPQRPLRGLTFDEALLTYVERQLGDGM